MWGILATDPRIKSRLFSALALAAGLGLAGCSDLDNALFGDQADTGGTPAAGSSDQFPLGGPGGTTAGTLPATGAAAAPGSAPVIAITPVAIDPGSNTGTAVSGTIATLRSQIVTLEEHLSANAGRLTELRNQGADAASSYQDAKARITTRLQVGTTRGNPELVSEWNVAQSALDALATNINNLNALGAAIATDSSSAHFALDQIEATYNVSGAVDEDHRQLRMLEDETNQTIVLIDRILKSTSENTQRQTAYAANERANLDDAGGGDQKRRTLRLRLGIARPRVGRRTHVGRDARLRRNPARRDPLRSPRCRLSANPLCGAHPGTPEQAQRRLLGRRRVADTRNRRCGPARADVGQEPRTGSAALHDGYGRSCDAARGGFGH